MYSKKEIWDYYKKISSELFILIEENMLENEKTIINKMVEHLNNYNEKYVFYLQIISDTNIKHKFIYTVKERKGLFIKPLFEKEFNIKQIIRSIKIDKILKK